MTKKIDFGCGWDPTEEFDLTAIENKTVKEAQQAAFTQAQSKAAFLEMQLAAQNHDADLLSALVASHHEYLTPNRLKTLGRVAIKNFSQNVIDVLKACPWNEVLSQDLILWCVNNDQEKAFEFAHEVFAQEDKKTNSTRIKDTYSVLMGATSNNYVLCNKYRAKLSATLSTNHKDELVGVLLQMLTSVTPKNSIAYQNMFEELSQCNWKKAFEHYWPYQYWRNFSESFGLTMLLNQYPHIAEQLNDVQKLQRLKEKRLELIALNSVFKIGLHECITKTMQPKDVFTAGFLQCITDGSSNLCIRDRDDSQINTPYLLLNSESYAAQNFRGKFLSFCKQKQIPWVVKFDLGVERLLKYDGDFLPKMAVSVQGQNVLSKLLEKPDNAYTVAEKLISMNSKQALAVLPGLTPAVNFSGWSIVHHIAVKLACVYENRIRDCAHLVESEYLNWDQVTVSGVSAKQLLMESVRYPTVTAILEEMFQKREIKLLNSAAKNSRKDNNLRTKSLTKRKI